MNVKKNVLVITSVLSLYLTSCQKDLKVEDPAAITAETSSDAVAADYAVETTPLVHRSVVTYVNSNVAGFWQSVPSKYSQTTKRYPLIVFIHGIGELGTSLSRINCCGLPRHLYNKTFPPNFNVNG